LKKLLIKKDQNQIFRSKNESFKRRKNGKEISYPTSFPQDPKNDQNDQKRNFSKRTEENFKDSNPAARGQ